MSFEIYHYKMNISLNNSKKLGFLLTIGLYSFMNNQSTSLSTHEINLEYSLEVDPEYSHILASQLGGWGIIDITKLDPKEDIESLDIRYAEIPSTVYKAQIVILDANRNGKFEYDSIDIVGLTSFNQKLNFLNINFIRSSKPIVVKIEDETYEIDLIEDGSKINLTKIEIGETQFDLTYPYRLPKIPVRALTKNATLNKSNNKYTYVEFWGTWCKGCIQIIPEIRSLKKDFNDRLNIISIDYMDNDLKRVKEYIIKYKMNWDHIVANRALMKEFATPYFPCGILFDPEGYLIEYGILPGEVGEILKSL